MSEKITAVLFRLPQDLKDQLEGIAEREQRSVAAQLRYLVEKEIKQQAEERQQKHAA